jgi:hypothetical protein
MPKSPRTQAIRTDADASRAENRTESHHDHATTVTTEHALHRR